MKRRFPPCATVSFLLSYPIILLVLMKHFTADRAKQTKTKAVVNEDPTDKLIRELKEQNEKLKAQLAGGKIDMTDIDAMAKRENLSKEEIGNVQLLIHFWTVLYTRWRFMFPRFIWFPQFV